MSCCKIRLPDDIDALVHQPTPGVLSNTHAANWLGGIPAVTGSFANNQGDPTSSIIASDYSAIVGGESNTIDASTHSFIGGGEDNIIDPSRAAAIIGGEGNRVTDHICSGIFVGGTTGAFPFGPNFIDSAAPGPDPTGFSAIVAGASNAITGTAQAGVIAGGLANSISAGLVGGILAGLVNSVTSDGGVVAGGQFNLVSAVRGAVVGGDTNIVSAPLAEDSAIVGGVENVIDISQSFIGGGRLNLIVTGDPFNERSGIVAGLGNLILDGDEHFIGGGKRNEIRQTAAVPLDDLDSNAIIGAQFCTIDTGESNAIVGGERNLIDGSLLGAPMIYSVIAGGVDNTVTGRLAGIVAGSDHLVAGNRSAIVGGAGHRISDFGGATPGPEDSFIGGGSGHIIERDVINPGPRNAIVGGLDNAIGSSALGDRICADSAIVGGVGNHMGDQGASFMGGGGDAVGGGGAFAPNVISGDGDLVNGIIGGTAITMAINTASFVGAGQTHFMFGNDESGILAGRGHSLLGTRGSTILGGDANTITSAGIQLDDHGIVGGVGHTITGFGTSRDGIVAGSAHLITDGAEDSVIAGGVMSVVTHSESFLCGSAPITTGARTFGHGTGPADPVGFRGAPPIPAPVLAPIPAPTGIPGLDAWIASVDAALKTQGLAV